MIGAVFTKISNFIGINGYLRKDRFVVNISNGIDVSKFIATKVEIPNLEIDFASRMYNGKYAFYPKFRKNDDLEITFLENADMSVKTTFGKYITQNIFAVNDVISGSYTRHYYSQYANLTITISPMSSSSQTSNATFVAFSAFPYSIKSEGFDAEDSNILYTSISFKYQLLTIHSQDGSDTFLSQGGFGSGNLSHPSVDLQTLMNQSSSNPLSIENLAQVNKNLNNSVLNMNTGTPFAVSYLNLQNLTDFSSLQNSISQNNYPSDTDSMAAQLYNI